ncbi:thioesterase family protein [Alkaliphilus serpentinus]|uniref:Fluoroacetyl-CoA-specific thioesterase-like domain-containing protein n=1 Tax=Alkaliphilus serpentinus TaxID=1482731 RepID=A0A833HL97_9FIRM|nr:hypothetical protein [Alkaliphilus serpentinus]KAB3525444.1 hypothetical protein F8153_15260 [Alkaliphilus serpentinus]
MVDIKLQEGMIYTIQKKVNYEDTTVSFGRSGIETLFSTPALVGLMIEAAVELVGDNIPDGFITVVKKLEVTHDKPTLQGMTVTIKAKLIEIKGNFLRFDMVCFDELGEIATGYQERHIVNKAALIKKAHRRAESLETKQ